MLFWKKSSCGSEEGELEEGETVAGGQASGDGEEGQRRETEGTWAWVREKRRWSEHYTNGTRLREAARG